MNIKYKFKQLRNRLFRRYDLIPTGLSKWNWCDKDCLMLYGMMELLKNYVEKEDALNVINWESDIVHVSAVKEIKTIYSWWLDYPNRLNQISQALDKWYDASHENLPPNNLDKWLNRKCSIKEQKCSNILHQLEQTLEAEEQEMLIRLIKIRKFLWT